MERNRPVCYRDLNMKSDFSYSLPVTIFREGKAFVAYTPALDLSTAGKTEAQARKMIIEAVETFFDELTEMGTLDKALKELGWTSVRGNLQPPKVVKHDFMKVRMPATV